MAKAGEIGRVAHAAPTRMDVCDSAAAPSPADARLVYILELQGACHPMHLMISHESIGEKKT